MEPFKRHIAQRRHGYVDAPEKLLARGVELHNRGAAPAATEPLCGTRQKAFEPPSAESPRDTPGCRTAEYFPRRRSASERQAPPATPSILRRYRNGPCRSGGKQNVAAIKIAATILLYDFFRDLEELSEAKDKSVFIAIRIIKAEVAKRRVKPYTDAWRVTPVVATVYLFLSIRICSTRIPSFPDIVEEYETKHFLDWNTEFNVGKNHVASMIVVIVVTAQRRISADFVKFVIWNIST